MTLFKTSETKKQTEVGRVQKLLKNALKKGDKYVIKTVLAELERVGSNLDDLQRIVRPILHEALLNIYAQNSKSITMAQYAKIMTLSSPSGRMYKLAFSHLMNCDLTEKEMGAIWYELRCSGASSEHMKKLLMKYLDMKKPNTAEIIEMFKNSGRFAHMFCLYTTAKMQAKTFAAVREYLNDTREYRKFRFLALDKQH